MIPQESDQFVPGTELRLLPAVNLLNEAFHLTSQAPAGLPNLYDKCSAHNKYRIWLVARSGVEISSSSCRFFVGYESHGAQFADKSRRTLTWAF